MEYKVTIAWKMGRWDVRIDYDLGDFGGRHRVKSGIPCEPGDMACGRAKMILSNVMFVIRDAFYNDAEEYWEDVQMEICKKINQEMFLEAEDVVWFRWPDFGAFAKYRIDQGSGILETQYGGLM